MKANKITETGYYWVVDEKTQDHVIGFVESNEENYLTICGRSVKHPRFDRYLFYGPIKLEDYKDDSV